MQQGRKIDGKGERLAVNSNDHSVSSLLLLMAAAVTGILIAVIGSVSFGSGVSPIVIPGLLLAATFLFGAIGGQKRSWMALVVWIWLPLFHLVQRLFGITDALDPDTFSSIVLLGAFTLIVAMIGTTAGVLARRLLTGSAHHGHGGYPA